MYSQFPPASVGASGGTFGLQAAASPDALRLVFVATHDEAHRIRGGLEAKRSWDLLPKDEVDERGQPRQVPGSVPRETLAKDAAAMRKLAGSLAKAYPAGPFEGWEQTWSNCEEKLLADAKKYPQARALRIEVISYRSSAEAMREIGLKLLKEGGRLDPLTSPECSEPPAQQVCLDERAIAYPPPTMRAIAPARTRVVAASQDQLALNTLRGRLGATENFIQFFRKTSGQSEFVDSSTKNAIDEASALSGLARMALERGDIVRATKLSDQAHRFVDEVYENLGGPQKPRKK